MEKGYSYFLRSVNFLFSNTTKFSQNGKQILFTVVVTCCISLDPVEILSFHVILQEKQIDYHAFISDYVGNTHSVWSKQRVQACCNS